MVVRRQRLIVKLSGASSADGRFSMIVVGIISLSLIEMTRQRIDFGLQNVADHRQSAVRVAVKRAVAEREFRFVAGRKQQPAFGIRDRHQDISAQTRLQILRRMGPAAHCGCRQVQFLQQNFETPS